MTYTHFTFTDSLPSILTHGLLARSPAHPDSIYHNDPSLHNQPVGVYASQYTSTAADWGSYNFVEYLSQHCQAPNITAVRFRGGAVYQHDPLGGPGVHCLSGNVEPSCFIETITFLLEDIHDSDWFDASAKGYEQEDQVARYLCGILDEHPFVRLPGQAIKHSVYDTFSQLVENRQVEELANIC